jgi:hypothetical protein
MGHGLLHAIGGGSEQLAWLRELQKGSEMKRAAAAVVAASAAAYSSKKKLKRSTCDDEDDDDDEEDSTSSQVPARPVARLSSSYSSS